MADARYAGEIIWPDGHEVEVYYASSTSDTWPGYHESCPLGKVGYWIGTHRQHCHITSRLEFCNQMREAEDVGGCLSGSLKRELARSSQC